MYSSYNMSREAGEEPNGAVTPGFQLPMVSLMAISFLTNESTTWHKLKSNLCTLQRRHSAPNHLRGAVAAGEDLRRIHKADQWVNIKQLLVLLGCIGCRYLCHRPLYFPQRYYCFTEKAQKVSWQAFRGTYEEKAAFFSSFWWKLKFNSSKLTITKFTWPSPGKLLHHMKRRRWESPWDATLMMSSITSQNRTSEMLHTTSSAGQRKTVALSKNGRRSLKH